MTEMAKKKKQMNQPKSTSDDGLTLKDQLNADVLSQLKLAKQSLVAQEKEQEEERRAKELFEKKQREKNMSFEELLEQYGDQGSKF